MVLDPIKQLQSLLDDRGEVLEKISSVQAALGSLQPTDSTVPVENIPSAAEPPQATAASLSQEPGYGRALQMLRDMQAQIETRVRPIAQQVIELEINKLREQSARDRATLSQRLAQLDQSLLNCVERIVECQKTQGDLLSLNEQLAALGSAPEPFPKSLPEQDPSRIIQSRVEDLHRRGRL